MPHKDPEARRAYEKKRSQTPQRRKAKQHYDQRRREQRQPEINSYQRAWYAEHRTEQRAKARARLLAARARDSAKHEALKSGRSARRKARRAANREAVRARELVYERTEASRLRRRAYNQRPEVRARQVVWSRARQQITLEATRAYHRAYERAAWARLTPEQKTLKYALHLQYLHEHPEVRRAIARRRKARKLAAPRNDLTKDQEALVIASRHGICDYCAHYHPGCLACKGGRHILTIDHVTPLAQKGSNTLWNIIACCKSCNSKKHTSPPPVPVQPLLL
jgi:5-methylcytosine-specific restriction endonuclease McrA